MGPYIVVCDRARFFRKNPHRAKMTKNGQKWSLVFSGIRVKWKFLRLINILQKLHAWEKSGSQVIVKNEISVFFNRQYFTNRLISDIDFWHVDRHEWKTQGSLTGFLKKTLIWANEPFWTQKLRILITLDSQEEFFKNLGQWKGLTGRWEWY